MAEINDHHSHKNTQHNGQYLKTVTNSMHEYNSGSDDTMNYESSPSPLLNYHGPDLHEVQVVTLAVP